MAHLSRGCLQGPHDARLATHLRAVGIRSIVTLPLRIACPDVRINP